MSDILIKNMKMPTCCDDCFALDDHGDYPYCLISHKKNLHIHKTKITTMPSCPLIELPKHGRLIDADALDICKREQQAWLDYEHNLDNEYLEGVKDGLHEASKQLSTAMTIIEAEEANK